MAPHPEEQPGLPAAPSGVPVQPASEHLSHVPEQWLAEPEHHNAADRLDRLAADYELITGLAWGKFEGADYQYFANELAKYGLAVMRGWMRRRLILARCRERGFGGLPEPPLDAFDDPDVLDELANETVAKALHHFRQDVLLVGKWDHHRGASLRTYFIGQCLIRFANIYRQWWRNESRRPHAVADHETLQELNGVHADGPEHRVVTLTEVDRALAAVRNPRVREALILRGLGLPNAEIGERLGTTEKAIERMLANERDRMRRRGIA